MTEERLTFDEWFGAVSSFDSRDEMWNADQRLYSLPSRVVASYVRRLLLEAPVLCRGITPARLGRMIWFFNGVCSSYWHEVRREEVPRDEQIATVRALGNFYRDFLDPYITQDVADAGQLGEAVFMMWDMDCLEGAAIFPGEEHLVEPIFEVLSIALRCSSIKCQESALHGLGHLEPYHPQRVHAEIDWALEESGRLNPSLVDYAQAARSGDLQ